MGEKRERYLCAMPPPTIFPTPFSLYVGEMLSRLDAQVIEGVRNYLSLNTQEKIGDTIKHTKFNYTCGMVKRPR